MTDTTTIDLAAGKLQKLEATVQSMATARAMLADERYGLAFAAEAENDKAAIKRIMEIKAEDRELASREHDLSVACAAARQRLQDAQAAEVAEEQRLRAVALGETYVKFVKLADTADVHLRGLGDTLDKLFETMNALHLLEASSAPTSMQALTFFELATHAVLGTSPIKRGFRHLPPNQRHTFGGLARDWSEPALRKLNGAANKQKESV
jgi:hypothetical protein